MGSCFGSSPKGIAQPTVPEKINNKNNAQEGRQDRSAEGDCAIHDDIRVIAIPRRPSSGSLDDDDDTSSWHTAQTYITPPVSPRLAPSATTPPVPSLDRSPQRPAQRHAFDRMNELTGAERAAIAALRVRLRGVGRHHRFETRSPELLHRFLMQFGGGAKNRNKFSQKELAKTEAAVRGTWAWREAHAVNAGLDELEAAVPPALRIPGGYFCGGWIGRDKDGCGVYYDRFALCNPGSLKNAGVEPQDCLNYCIWRNETSHAIMEACSSPGTAAHHQFYAILDSQNLGWRLLSPTAIGIFQKMYKQDERHWPDRVKGVIIINAPWLFSRLWSLIKHFVNPYTKSLIQIVSARDSLATLTRYVDEDQIPAYLLQGFQGDGYAGGGLRALGEEHDPQCRLRVQCGGDAPDTRGGGPFVPSFVPRSGPPRAATAAANHLVWQYDRDFDPRTKRWMYAPLEEEGEAGGQGGGGALAAI